MAVRSKQVALPEGSLILVTGASGYIASHIIFQALELGYRVRGTVRSADKAEKTKAMFKSDKYESAVVGDLAEEGAFDESMRGIAAVIHTASILTFSPDPNQVVPQTVAGATGILRSAMKVSSVKRFVYTSSSTATTMPKPGQKFKIDQTTWNDEALEAAWAPPPYDHSRAYTVYAASKTSAEKAIWEFVEKEKPSFVVNCVLPYANFGRVIDGVTGPTGCWAPDLLTKGQKPILQLSQWFVNVDDNARIHVAAAVLDESVVNKRIIAFGYPYTVNELIDTIQKLRPAAKLPPHDDEPPNFRDITEPDNVLGSELLKKWWGQDGYKNLEVTIQENLEGY